MRPINYQLTNSIVNNLISLEVNKTLISKVKLDQKLGQKVEEKQMVSNIFHLAHMLGLEITYKDCEKFIQGKISIGTDERYRILNNYRNAIEYIRSNKLNTYVDINSKLAVHLNKLLIHEWKENWDAKIRNSVEIDNAFDSWLVMMDDSVQLDEINYEVENTFDWYKNNTLRINPIIRISVLAFRLIRIMPFGILNKLTIIALCDFLLQKNGYIDGNSFALMKLFDKYDKDYLSIWEKVNLSSTGNITFWIESFIFHIASEIKDQHDEIFKMKEEDEERNVSQPFLYLNKRQLKILKYLQSIPTVKREDYVQMFDVSTMTAFRDLNVLVKRKLLKIDGQGRATRYELANR